MKIYITTAKYLCCLIAGLVAVACTKTEYEPTKLPYNDIKRFAVKGFLDGDTLIGVVSNNEIQVYWDQAVPLPQSIQPVIAVSEGAAISPASGETVALTANTVYTVKAQDGSEQSYTVKFILQQPEPIVLAAPNALNLRWKNSTALAITGQYFLAAGDTSSIRVFARRASDGVEFDLPLDHQITKSTYLVAFLPDFTAESDTGRHDIKLSIGSKTIDVAQGKISPPSMISRFFTLEKKLTSLSAGDDITFNIDDQEEGKIYKFYRGRFTKVIIQTADEKETDYKFFEITDFEQNADNIKFKVPAEVKEFAGYKVINIRFQYPDASRWDGVDEVWHMLDGQVVPIK